MIFYVDGCLALLILFESNLGNFLSTQDNYSVPHFILITQFLFVSLIYWIQAVYTQMSSLRIFVECNADFIHYSHHSVLETDLYYLNGGFFNMVSSIWPWRTLSLVASRVLHNILFIWHGNLINLLTKLAATRSLFHLYLHCPSCMNLILLLVGGFYFSVCSKQLSSYQMWILCYGSYSIWLSRSISLLISGIIRYERMEQSKKLKNKEDSLIHDIHGCQLNWFHFRLIELDRDPSNLDRFPRQESEISQMLIENHNFKRMW